MLKTDVTIPTSDHLSRRRADRFRRVWLFDLPFVDAESTARVAAALVKVDTDDHDLRLPILVAPDVDDLVRLAGPDIDDEVAEIVRNSRWVLPDGRAIVAISKRMGTPLTSRLPGTTVFEHLWNRVASDGVAAVVVAPRRGVAERLAAEHEGCRFVVPPRADVDDAATIDTVAAACVDRAVAERPRFVFIGLAFGTDQRLAKAILDRWPDQAGPPPIVLCLGDTFATYLGRSDERRARRPHRSDVRRVVARDRAFLRLARAELARR